MVDSSRIMDFGGLDLRVKSVVSGYDNPNTGIVTTIAAGATKTLTADDQNKTVLLDTLAGSVVTLPASTGSGRVYKFLVSVLATSASHIVKVANATDVMRGLAIFADTDGTAAVNAFITAATSDTITLNRSTTGSVTVGENILVEDYAAGFFKVTCYLSNTGTPTTPFSATV